MRMPSPSSPSGMARGVLPGLIIPTSCDSATLKRIDLNTGNSSDGDPPLLLTLVTAPQDAARHVRHLLGPGGAAAAAAARGSSVLLVTKYEREASSEGGYAAIHGVGSGRIDEDSVINQEDEQMNFVNVARLHSYAELMSFLTGLMCLPEETDGEQDSTSPRPRLPEIIVLDNLGAFLEKRRAEDESAVDDSPMLPVWRALELLRTVSHRKRRSDGDGVQVIVGLCLSSPPPQFTGPLACLVDETWRAEANQPGTVRLTQESCKEGGSRLRLTFAEGGKNGQSYYFPVKVEEAHSSS